MLFRMKNVSHKFLQFVPCDVRENFHHKDLYGLVLKAEYSLRLSKQERLLELVYLRLGNDDVEEVVKAIYVAILCRETKANLRSLMSRVVTLLIGHSPPFLALDDFVNNRHHKDDGFVNTIALHMHLWDHIFLLLLRRTGCLFTSSSK